MDNLCHTLTGAALSRAGLNTRTAYAGVTLMVAANLPDLDVLVYFTDVPPVAFRRGWTHGVVAQLLLPPALTLVMLLVARLRRPSAAGPPVHAGWLLALSYIGLGSHVFLDFLNTYGVRLLAPVDWRWFYGDSVFIIDPWLWLGLGAGVLLARRRGVPGPARVALLASVLYIGVLLASTVAAREAVRAEWQARAGRPPEALMVGPVPAWPLRREVIIDAGEVYRIGSFTWWPRELVLDPEPVPKNERQPAVARAREESREIRGFLVWSRFPFWDVVVAGDGVRVTVADARFMATGARFAASTVLGPDPAEGESPPAAPAGAAATPPGSSRRTDR